MECRPAALRDLAADEVVDRAAFYYETHWSCHWKMYWRQLASLPCTLKTQLLNELSRREKLADDNIEYLIHSSLVSLSLRNCIKSDKTINLLASHCPALRRLDIGARYPGYNGMSSKSLISFFECCTHLGELCAENCIDLNDDAVEALISRNGPHLTTLKLRGCLSVSDRSLKLCADWCKHLRCLDVSVTSVSDDGVCYLAKGFCAQTLVEFAVQNCSHVTNLSIAFVQNSMRNLERFAFEGTRAHHNLFEQVAGAAQDDVEVHNVHI